MLKRLVNAIGQALGITQPAMLVQVIQDSLNGGNSNTVLDTPRQPAKRGRKLKQTLAQQDTQEPSLQLDTLPVRTRTKKSSTRGLKQAETVSQSSPRKRKPSVAQSTKVEASSSKEQSPQGKRGRGRPSKTPALLTQQPVSQAKTPKRKAVASTTQVKKRTPSKTRVQTRTVRPSKVSGS